jgi:hypothetical protein
VKYREIVRLIEADGWRLSGQRGSHRQYEHPTKPGKVRSRARRIETYQRARLRISFIKPD